jgi:hypothetical protein
MTALPAPRLANPMTSQSIQPVQLKHHCHLKAFDHFFSEHYVIGNLEGLGWSPVFSTFVFIAAPALMATKGF